MTSMLLCNLQLMQRVLGCGDSCHLITSQSTDELEQEILLQMGPVTDEQIAKSMEDYRKMVQCTNVTVLVCAACNVKALDEDGKLCELHELDRLQLSDKQQQTYNNYDSDLRKHFNVYIHHDNGTGRIVYYGLNPDLVVVTGDDKSDGKVRVPLCTTCRDAIGSGKLPKYCIANGYDFGRYADLPAVDVRRITSIEHHANLSHLQGDRWPANNSWTHCVSTQ
jgi:hypothetical protein